MNLKLSVNNWKLKWSTSIDNSSIFKKMHFSFFLYFSFLFQNALSISFNDNYFIHVVLLSVFSLLYKLYAENWMCLQFMQLAPPRFTIYHSSDWSMINNLITELLKNIPQWQKCVINSKRKTSRNIWMCRNDQKWVGKKMQSNFFAYFNFLWIRKEIWR